MAGEGRIRHIVLFWLRDPESDADRAALVAGLRSLAAIDVVLSCEVGVPAATEARGSVDHSYDVAEILTFASLADQLAYQRHPVHAQFVERCRHLWERERIYDIADAG